MKKIALLALVLLVAGALFVPAVSADILEESSSKAEMYDYTSKGSTTWPGTCLYIYRIENYHGLEFVYAKIPAEGISATFLNSIKASPYYECPVTLKIGTTTIGTGTAYYNGLFSSSGSVTGLQQWIEIDTFDPGTRTGAQIVSIVPSNGTLFNGYSYYQSNIGPSVDNPIGFMTTTSGVNKYYTSSVMVRTDFYWTNILNYDDRFLELTRNVDGIPYASTLTVSTTLGNYTDYSANNIKVPYSGVASWTVTSPTGKLFTGQIGDVPDDPVETPTLRTGTVTMTDHNGTMITGFEVTAVNAYTDEEYTVSTDTDVAVITLPMDRTITLRNPQTGEYEETTVGYYRFFGQAPGYKMVNEDGIQVAVMPQKYGSYQLCDILVTSESGYLSGQHKFQIRSRSDNSILQTGTISAKSATTGEWYNTTVSGGIATLILPYDTSNSISQYAGNYYVYATSPGYQDSDYGTQIVVMPHTVSEINTVLLTPIGGIPPAGNVTLRIQVFSETGPGVNNAKIFIAGVLGEGSSVWDTYTTSSTGYLSVSVPGNSTYDIVASRAGYYDSARRIEVFTEDPALIEIKLYRSGGPTVEPTTQPTGWPTPTPTPGGSFIDQSAQAVATFMGVSFDVGKTALGLFITTTVGYTTARKLRGGAPEFGIGMLAGAMLCVAIGLLPVWIFVVMVIIIGGLLGYKYMNGGN